MRELGVVHQHGDPDEAGRLANADAARAAHIVLLATSETDPRADGSQAHMAAECVEQRNRERLLQFDPQARLIHPVRAYPEMLVRALDAPAPRRSLRTCPVARGIPERYDVELADLAWPEIVWRVVRAGGGTPIAYLDGADPVVSCPAGSDPIPARALFVIVDGQTVPSVDAVRTALAHGKS